MASCLLMWVYPQLGLVGSVVGSGEGPAPSDLHYALSKYA
jgi:hypothetical protein